MSSLSDDKNTQNSHSDVTILYHLRRRPLLPIRWKNAPGVDSFIENIIRKQAENIYFYQCQKMPKNTENILFTKGVQYVNVQCNGDAFANPLQNYDNCSILKSTKQSRLIEK